MVATDLLYLVVALLLGFALGVLAILVFRRRPPAEPAPEARRARRPRSAPEPTAVPVSGARAESWEDVEFEVVQDDAPATPAPAASSPTRAPRPPPARAVQPLPPLDEVESSVPTEWARRHVGPPEPGRVKGICSGCGTPLSISLRRPLRVACPVCGRTRLLA